MDIEITEQVENPPQLNWDNAIFPVVAYWEGSDTYDRLFVLALKNDGPNIVEGMVRGIALNGPEAGEEHYYSIDTWQPYDGTIKLRLSNTFSADEEMVREVDSPYEQAAEQPDEEAQRTPWEIYQEIQEKKAPYIIDYISKVNDTVRKDVDSEVLKRTAEEIIAAIKRLRNAND